jgi:hypothetical protein
MLFFITRQHVYLVFVLLLPLLGSFSSQKATTIANPTKTVGGSLFNVTSPPYYPSPWMDGSGGWEDAYRRAQEFVSQLTLLEKVNLTTGVG